MGYPQQPQYGQAAPTSYPAQPAPQQSAYTQDPWANGNLPTGAYDNADPFDNAIPEGRGQRVQLAGPDGRPYLHQGEPVMVSPPSLRTLGPGRLIFIVPKKIERNMKNPFEGGWKDFIDRLTADVIVCDGTGERFGGDPTKGIPDLLGPFPVPCVIEDMWIQNDGIIERVPENLIGNGFKIGRVTKAKTKSNRTAWNFGSPDEDPAKAAAIVQSLRPLWAAYQNQQLPILSLKTLAERYGVKPGAAPVQTQPANPYPAGATVPVFGGHVPVQQQPPAWPAMQPGQNMAPIQHGFGIGDPRTDAVPPYGPTQPPVSAPVAPAADWTLSAPVPPGWEATWPTLTPAVREQMLAQLGVRNPNSAHDVTAPPPMQPPASAYGQAPPF
jgi:hypothetical protein